MSIQIILTSPQSTYHPGDTVSGYVLVNLSEEKKVNKICLGASGRARVLFWHGRGEHTRYYKSKRIYLNKHFILWQKNNSKGQKRVAAGDTKYPFSVTIPLNAGPSLESTYGYIRYKLKAILDMPWSLDVTFDIDINVGIPMDIHSVPMYIQPQSSCIYKSNVSSSNLIQFTVSIPRKSELQ
ncbi:hypothetical protein FO519_008310 [Halicephalobus sp. NKZ332]|nr:hypothetical protein FO519_008310 [Halicephalobus sp. NKZ332]